MVICLESRSNLRIPTLISNHAIRRSLPHERLWSSPKKVDTDRIDLFVSLGVFSEFGNVD